MERVSVVTARYQHSAFPTDVCLAIARQSASIYAVVGLQVIRGRYALEDENGILIKWRNNSIWSLVFAKFALGAARRAPPAVKAKRGCQSPKLGCLGGVVCLGDLPRPNKLTNGEAVAVRCLL